MAQASRHYEINTQVWLDDLNRKYRRVVDLSTVPEPEWDAIAPPLRSAWE